MRKHDLKRKLTNCFTKLQLQFLVLRRATQKRDNLLGSFPVLHVKVVFYDVVAVFPFSKRHSLRTSAERIDGRGTGAPCVRLLTFIILVVSLNDPNQFQNCSV